MASVPYALLKPVVRTALRVFYRKIHCERKDQVPPDVPVILVANHQNALIDPLVLAICLDRHVNFMARASAFKNPVAAFLLRQLHMLPVFRPRDQVDIRAANAPVFAAAHQRLLKNEIIGIFPEGDHHGRRVLRPLRKGFARLAWMSLKEHKEVWIVPVGLDFSSHWEMHSRVIMRFGEAFSSMEIWDEQGDETAFVNACTEKVRKAITELMVSVPHEDADRILWKLDHYRLMEDELSDLDDRRRFGLWLSAKSQEELTVVRKALEDYVAVLRMYDLNDTAFRGTKLCSRLRLPARLGKLSLAPSNILLHWIERKVIEDEQFTATVKFALRLVGIPVYWILLILLAFVILPGQLAVISIFLIAFCQYSWWYLRREGVSVNRMKPAIRKEAEERRQALLDLLHFKG